MMKATKEQIQDFLDNFAQDFAENYKKIYERTKSLQYIPISRGRLRY
jgi:hypothetical protein